MLFVSCFHVDSRPACFALISNLGHLTRLLNVYLGSACMGRTSDVTSSEPSLKGGRHT
jgi:hypothetical protein